MTQDEPDDTDQVDQAAAAELRTDVLVTIDTSGVCPETRPQQVLLLQCLPSYPNNDANPQSRLKGSYADGLCTQPVTIRTLNP
jgi:hypothetical protein